MTNHIPNNNNIFIFHILFINFEERNIVDIYYYYYYIATISLY